MDNARDGNAIYLKVTALVVGKLYAIQIVRILSFLKIRSIKMICVFSIILPEPNIYVNMFCMCVLYCCKV